MDTISRENNSMLPVGGIIVGVIALLVGGYAAITISKVNKTLADHESKLGKIEAVESTANAAQQTAVNAEKYAKALEGQTNEAFKQIGPIIGNLQASVTKLEESAKKAPAPAASGKKGEKGEVVAGPGEYVVKAGDTGMKIATAHHVSVSDLTSVNPGVNWSKLKVGDKIKLPVAAPKK
jgi:LysM repeat protein